MLKKKNEKGQALIELIIFLPLMFMFYSMISGFANAINGSINQQKITRAYFYYRVQNNSTIPKPDVDNTQNNWTTFGMFFIGWKDYFESQKPMAPCYQLTIPLASAGDDKCENKYTSDSTLYIRVQTVYGVCGATYWTDQNKVIQIPDASGMTFDQVTSTSSCLLTK